MKKNLDPKKTFGEKPPLWAILFLLLALVSLVIVVVARYAPSFADFFNRRIASIIRLLLAKLSDIVPFSSAELLLLLLPVFCGIIVFLSVRLTLDTWKHVLSYAISLLSVFSLIFSVFVWSFGTGYYVPELEKKLDLESVPVTAENLQDTAKWLAGEITALSAEIYYSPDGSSVMPYSLDDMNQKLMDAYASAASKYDFIQQFNSDIKPVMSSVAMSYTHLTGVYTFFTGEANLNIDFPDYTLPFTAAHEFAHQRGISRENEANFVAFLVCSQSNDPYLQYCGYLNLYEYVISALYSADRDMYQALWSALPEHVIEEMRAYSRFYNKYRDSKAGKVNNAVNNTFLQANGQSEGTESYGLVVDLAVSYYCEKIK